MHGLEIPFYVTSKSVEAGSELLGKFNDIISFFG
jgi:hypothetical protein